RLSASGLIPPQHQSASPDIHQRLVAPQRIAASTTVCLTAAYSRPRPRSLRLSLSLWQQLPESIPRCKVHWVSRSSSFIVADPSRPVLSESHAGTMTSNFKSANFEHPSGAVRALRFTLEAGGEIVAGMALAFTQPVLCVSGDSVLIGSSISPAGKLAVPSALHKQTLLSEQHCWTVQNNGREKSLIGNKSVLTQPQFTSVDSSILAVAVALCSGSTVWTLDSAASVFSQEEVAAHHTCSDSHEKPASRSKRADCALKCEQPIVKFCSAFAFVPEKEALPALRDTTADFAPVAPGTNRPDQRTRIPSDSAQVEGELSFARSWTEYENGFGDDTDFWIARRSFCESRAVTWSDELYVCEYSGFTVADASTNYTMTGISYLSGSSNTTADSFHFNSGMQFSTHGPGQRPNLEIIVPAALET
uniref:Fibrinogen C-terminal domain-containing protein n=1 Tax=Macrostomum lignano TaxID=282301 RepID=A0A1I8FGP2_9PLAT